MNNRQQAREEALFVLLMEQVARQQDLQARQLGRALEEDPEAALSPALQQRCMQTLRRGFRRRDRQAAGRTTRRVMSRVAVAVLAAVLCLTAAFAVSPTLRSKALHWAAKVFPTHTELRLNPDAAPANGQTYEPVVNWLPVGLTLYESLIFVFLRAFDCSEKLVNTVSNNVLLFSSIFRLHPGGGGCIIRIVQN